MGLGINQSSGVVVNAVTSVRTELEETVRLASDLTPAYLCAPLRLKNNSYYAAVR